MPGSFLLVILTAGFGMLFALPVIIVPWLFAPRNPTPMKRATFEAGQIPSGDTRIHLMMQYYPYLLIFVVLDVVSMFLFAWATAVVAVSAAVTIGLFLGLIFIPLGLAIHLAKVREIW